MTDITMCANPDCKWKKKCYRHEAPVNEYWQSYSHYPTPKKLKECKDFIKLDKKE